MIKTISLILAVFSLLLSTSALAETQAQKYYPMDIPNLSNLIPNMEDELVSERSAQYQNRARARGIYFFEILAVDSPRYGREYVSRNTRTTTHDHGGSFIRVHVFQAGYGSADYATLNGIRKSPAYRKSLCGRDFHECRAGETITGYLYGFDFRGQQYGYFSVSANASAAPFGYWTDSLYIQ